MRLHAVPAYARSYDNVVDCLKDWNAGKDFKIAGGPYFSIRDVEAIKAKGYHEIHISELNYAVRTNHTVLITL